MELVQSLITILLFLVILGGLVLIHEYGHFITARMAKVRVLEFGVGFPPRARVIGTGKAPGYDAHRPAAAEPALPPGVDPDSPEADAFRATGSRMDAGGRGGTLYTLNWLPIGGFVKLEGEDGDGADDPHSFVNAKLPVKLIILIAGVTMNLLLSFVIFTGIAMYGEPGLGLTFKTVSTASPAAVAGLEPGDRLVAIDGRTYSIFDRPELPIEDLRALAGQTVTLGIVHADGASGDYVVTLRVPSSPNEGALGIGSLGGEPVGSVHYTPVEAVQVGAERTADAFGLILGGLGDLGRSSVPTPRSAPPASGPGGTAVSRGNVLWSRGPLYVLYRAGLLSATPALVNTLPFPPLDGGR